MEVCASGDQLAAILAGQTAAGAQSVGGAAATGGSSASEALDRDTATSTTSATLVLNGNNPAEWPLNQAWNDNLGALFTHDGQSETIHSTTTVDVTVAGTNTIDYWAQIPGANFLHTTRAVVVEGAANENQAISTDATSTAQ